MTKIKRYCIEVLTEDGRLNYQGFETRETAREALKSLAEAVKESRTGGFIMLKDELVFNSAYFIGAMIYETDDWIDDPMDLCCTPVHDPRNQTLDIYFDGTETKTVTEDE